MGGLVKLNPVRRNLNIQLKGFINISGAIAIPEVSHMAKLLCFGDCKALYFFSAEIFTNGPINGRGLDKELRWHMGIPVVLHNTRIADVR